MISFLHKFDAYTYFLVYFIFLQMFVLFHFIYILFTHFSNKFYIFADIQTTKMSSKEELEKLTVAQLKEKLKSRKLAISGAKTDLINRLHESIMTEEKLLEEGPGGESIDLSNVNMDEVLGVLDDEKDSAASSHLLGDKSTSELLRQSDERLSLSIGTDGGKGTSQQQSPVKNSEKNAVSASQSGSSIASNNQNNAAVTGDAEKKQLPMDEAKKVQLKTAARLGVPLAGAGGGDAETKGGVAAKKRVGNEEELKAKRATRFGIVDETKRKSATEEDDKMLKRAERFGLPLKRGAAAMESSSTTAAGDGDALQKRAKRFGMIISANGGEQDEKKAARAKRFGGSVAAT